MIQLPGRGAMAQTSKMIAKRSAENPLFKKVLDSQRAFAERAGRWAGDTNVNFRMAYNHYFAPKKAG